MKDVLPSKEMLFVDPNRPWIRDSRGRHHNLLAILDWPQCSNEDSSENDDDDDDVATVADESVGVDASSSSSPRSLCARVACMRPCAKNPRTGEFHSYCSVQCQYLASEHQSTGN